MVRHTEGNQSYLKTVRNNETHYARLGTPNVSEETSQNVSIARIVSEFRGLWFTPYEKVGTVTRNGTTFTKYEATGPGYYANGTVGNETIASFSATVLVGEDGLVRYFQEEIVYERDGNRMVDVRTVRYVDVNVTDVSRPNWLDEFEVDDDEDENEYERTRNANCSLRESACMAEERAPVDVFVYGTLTDSEQVVQVVSEFEFRGAATLDGLHRVEGEYPTLAPDGEVPGCILRTPEIEALDAYEGVESGLYVRVSVPWEDAEGREEVGVYVGDPDALGADADWPGEGAFPARVRRFVREESVVVRPHEPE